MNFHLDLLVYLHTVTKHCANFVFGIITMGNAFLYVSESNRCNCKRLTAPDEMPHTEFGRSHFYTALMTLIRMQCEVTKWIDM